MTQLFPSASELAEHARMQPDFAAWQRGYGPLQHSPQTCAAVYRLAHQLVQAGQQADLATVYRHFHALDRLTAAGLWLVVHMTYALRVRLDGEELAAGDFKITPEGHTGGALNMVPAYAGYLALNNLTGETRGWLMGQGHCVAAIEALNLLTANQHPEQAARYPCDEAGMSQLVADFY
ncbi:xylulose 5-phosphate 3-epimerase, partial [Pseudomonas sp. HMWF010]